ncbi:hypothetical protein BLOT_008809 [Blomia tropicalis]|nr:hypothetical protein BLOT_008809 [Blomia tropicalis]
MDRLYRTIGLLIVFALFADCHRTTLNKRNKEDVKTYLTKANEELRVQKHVMGLASWAQSSNITAENDAAYIEALEKFDVFSKKQFNDVKAYFDEMPSLEPYYRRQLEKMGNIQTSALSLTDSTRFSEVSLRMKVLYSKASISINGKDNLELEPDLTELLADETDEKLLRDIWMKWRDAIGPTMRPDFIKYYTLGNKAAKANALPGKEFKTYDDLWMAEWETSDMKEQVDKLMDQIMPFYQKIHAYVRYFLKKKYGESVMPDDGTIPAHLLGNMWAQQWSNVLNTITEMNPNPDVDQIDTKVNEKLKNWTVEDMFRLSESFFHGLGMKNMTEKFWKNSIMTKPKDRNLTGHASAWDFYDNDGDFRIKMLTEKTIHDLITIHHEMGHVQYYMNYESQPAIYRRGANPGFHEAIGDLIALSVATPQHLMKVKLLDEETEANLEKINLNYQLKMALDKVSFLPFAYVMDKWRWDVFSDPSIGVQLNKRWWEYRLKFQGISPPKDTRKRNENDFDPGAKYHIPAGVEYVRYFVSHILQFQFYEQMCSYVKGWTSLYQCDFDGNTDAGKALMDTLAKGSSDVWPNILNDFIGSPTMSTSSLEKYFEPLSKYLDKFIKEKNIEVGWNANVDNYVEPIKPNDYLKDANEQLQNQLNLVTLAEWAQGSDINEENEQALIEATSDFNIFRQKQFAETKKFNYSSLEPYEKRQFEKFAVIGTSALNETDAKTFQANLLKMEQVFSTAKVSAGGESNLELEPDLTNILSSSTNESLLREVWVNFRDVTGRKIRTNYVTYVDLGNKAAKLNALPDKEFKTFDDLWMFSWEVDDLKDQVAELIKELHPLYQKVHAYVRYHLKTKYNSTMPDDGTIPAHLVGNMWAQSWSNLLNTIPELNPYPDVDPIDAKVNEKLTKWTIDEMFKLSEKFFVGLGMDSMTDIFWKKSILTKPTNRSMTCHASAWDFYSPQDFRIKMCTEKTIDELTTIHHEMGHIQYFMNYASQPTIYREGANPGFHEAIGDLIALSVATPEHLSKIKLLDPITDPEQLKKINLNFQMKMALEKIVFLPFSYVMDKWRWDIFGDSSLESVMNKHFWNLTIQYQGISPPITDRKRNEVDFDPGAKYHIPAGVEYVRYFASHVLQFQFFASMCKSHTDSGKDLYQCDFDENKESGKRLIQLLKKGSNDTWKNILKEFVGTEKMSLEPLNNYFKPLDTFLDKFLSDNNITVGWKASVADYVDSGASITTISTTILLVFIAFCLYLH